MELGTILASGWSSGLNLYATALLIGLAGRFDWAETPDQLQQPWVLAVLFTLFAVEFVVAGLKPILVDILREGLKG